MEGEKLKIDLLFSLFAHATKSQERDGEMSVSLIIFYWIQLKEAAEQLPENNMLAFEA